MIETEVSRDVLNERLPAEVLHRFSETLARISKRSVLHWTEHCVECAMPQCYSTCDLYERRSDGKCRRFVDGFQRVASASEAELFKIKFKKWGKIETQGSHRAYDLTTRSRLENKNLAFDRVSNLLPISAVRNKLVRRRYSQKKSFVANSAIGVEVNPDYFVLEVYNPNGDATNLLLEIRSQNPKFAPMPFLLRADVPSGYSIHEVPFVEISKRLPLDEPFLISIIPDEEFAERELYFGVVDFVKYIQSSDSTKEDKKENKKVKCVVWDLDNTIWNGVLIEDGIEKLTLKDDIESILQGIEDRGIINSIASKNNHELAMEAVEHFNLKKYFLFPNIGWGPKSNGIKNIARSMNVNLDTLFFIDDNEFELEEVRSVLSSVRTCNALEYLELLEKPEFQVPITEESRRRKSFYKNEENRKLKEDVFDGDYFAFLRSCEIVLTVHSISTGNTTRIYELAQRTNQMNFSGNRYQLADIEAIRDNDELDSYVLSCTDKFGDYGIIGFGVVSMDGPQLEDLMFSCRIQSKRIEHAFMTFLLSKYSVDSEFKVRYVETPKNRFSAQVFYDYEFEPLLQLSSEKILVFPKGREIPNDEIVTIKDDRFQKSSY